MEATKVGITAVSAVGMFAAGLGVLIIAVKSEAIAKSMASDGLSEGLKGHMSYPDAGRQFGQAAFEAFEIQHYLGNPRRSWFDYLIGKK